jgi:hypothetical protein
MKISKKDFLQMQEKYKKEVKKGGSGKNRKGKVTDQTEWIFFDRETLEGILEKADKDPKKGGIKFFIGQYSEEIAEKFYPEEPENYAGMLTLVMAPANLEKNQVIETSSLGEEDSYANRGMQCPPRCLKNDN